MNLKIANYLVSYSPQPWHNDRPRSRFFSLNALHSSKQINHKMGKGGTHTQNIPRKNKPQIISTNLVLNAAQDTNCFKSRQRQLNARLADAEQG